MTTQLKPNDLIERTNYRRIDGHKVQTGVDRIYVISVERCTRTLHGVTQTGQYFSYGYVDLAAGRWGMSWLTDDGQPVMTYEPSLKVVGTYVPPRPAWWR